jgi:minimal PKS acyl carrier protein
MTDNQLTIDQLRTILTEAAGAAEDPGAGVDVEDAEFTDLGYDSISLLEAAGRIERQCGVKLDDDLIVSARTPRALLAVVNERLATSS